MSQHFYSTVHHGQPITVLAGWDRALQGYFLVVEPDQDRSEDKALYCNLDDQKLLERLGFAETFDYFLTVLEGLQIELPDRMVREIRLDGAKNMGNRCVSYDASGNIRREAAAP